MRATVQFDVDVDLSADELADRVQVALDDWDVPAQWAVRVSLEAGPDRLDALLTEAQRRGLLGGEPRWWDGITPRDPGGKVR